MLPDLIAIYIVEVVSTPRKNVKIILEEKAKCRLTESFQESAHIKNSCRIAVAISLSQAIEKKLSAQLVL